MNRIVAVILLTLSSVALSHAQQRTPPPQPPTPELEVSESSPDYEAVFRSGGQAYIEGRFADAIRIYDQAIEEYPTQPDLWLNKALTHLARSSATYAAASQIPDEVLRRSRTEEARQDIREAVKAADKAVDLVKDMPAPTEPARMSGFETLKLMSLRARANAYGMFATQVDESYATPAFAAYQDYIGVEPEEQHRHGARLVAARMLLMAYRFDQAFEEYQRLLDVNLDDVEALLGAGVSLVNAGFITKELPKIKRGIEHLRRFVEKAPTSHRLKGSAEEALDYLKQARRPIEIPATHATAGAETAPEGASGQSQSLPVESGIVNGKAVSLPQPPHPLIAKFARAEGTVAVQVLLDERGSVIEASSIEGHPLLQGVAAAAALKAKFTPTLLSGKPVRVTGVITYNFVRK